MFNTFLSITTLTLYSSKAVHSGTDRTDFVKPVLIEGIAGAEMDHATDDYHYVENLMTGTDSIESAMTRAFRELCHIEDSTEDVS